ncbi:hypothetical protein NITMOv2_2223 [Nitrospira moscoviensis]|uniref:Uncharacterized protein n=1 Tax=Nitrospira moscoviensis TaxID=42253 RepID=A0A0K2GCQ0_NITMO|nr:hypothetical protein NITMOv2_2223 [Nitrospira moscoviensis]
MRAISSGAWRGAGRCWWASGPASSCSRWLSIGRRRRNPVFPRPHRFLYFWAPWWAQPVSSWDSRANDPRRAGHGTRFQGQTIYLARQESAGEIKTLFLWIGKEMTVNGLLRGD